MWWWLWWRKEENHRIVVIKLLRLGRMFFEHCQVWGFHHILGQPVPMLDQPSMKNFFLTANLNLSWSNLGSWPFVVSLVTWERGLTSPGCTLLSHVEEFPQLPQLLFISIVLQTFPQLRCLPLDTLQPLKVFLGWCGQLELLLNECCHLISAHSCSSLQLKKEAKKEAPGRSCDIPALCSTEQWNAQRRGFSL